MHRFNQAENKLLRDYPRFGARARSLAIDLLARRYREAESDDERWLLYLLAVEQYCMLLEAFEGMFRAVRDRSRKPIVESLREDFNPGNLSSQLAAKSTEEVLKELNIEYTQFPLKDQETIRGRMAELVDWLRRISEHNRDFIVPVFGALKHKFLVYLDEHGVPRFVLHPAQVKIIDERFAHLSRGEVEPPDDIDYLVRMAKWLEDAIKDLLWIRLVELE